MKRTKQPKPANDPRLISAPPDTVPVEEAAKQCGLRPTTLVHMIRRNSVWDPIGGELRNGSFVVYPNTIRDSLPKQS